ncbi:DUF3422 domain-containing protein [soil metagenome]
MTASTLPANLPERVALAEEVHARPPEPLTAPARASFVALLVDAEARGLELRHLARLCEQHQQTPPSDGAVHWSGRIGDLRLKWERHGEFSSYSFLLAGRVVEAFSDTAAARLPGDWLAGLPGQTVMAAHAELLHGEEEAPLAVLQQQYFGGHPLVGAEIAGGAGQAFSDFQIHADGFSRFVLLGRQFTPSMGGRMLQRLFEIEAYRMMALLALPVARRLSPRLLEIERALARLTDDIAKDGGRDELLLHDLTRLAAEVESGLAASQFRFGACRAYADLVRTRIAELREIRIPGLQTLDEFMSRRFAPAVSTCATVSQRLHDLSERVAQASHLLSTRVDIAREKQNHALLASMDRRAHLQLRLQQTVEGLSIAAIVYYMAGVVGYLAKGAKALGLGVNVDLVVGLSVPLLVIVTMTAVRRARHAADEREALPGEH